MDPPTRQEMEARIAELSRENAMLEKVAPCQLSSHLDQAECADDFFFSSITALAS